MKDIVQELNEVNMPPRMLYPARLFEGTIQSSGTGNYLAIHNLESEFASIKESLLKTNKKLLCTWQ